MDKDAIIFAKSSGKSIDKFMDMDSLDLEREFRAFMQI
jgi:hypothetical protein